MQYHPTHFLAIIGGSVAGSIAAALFAERGFKVAVFEQGPRPYGKIEDGLPKWHVKLQAQEERKIDERLSHPNIFYIPNTKLGKDIDFPELVQSWGFSAILLANGAWKDRPLPLEGVDAYVGKGLIYQNELVKWFNHSHESNYDGPSYTIPDDTLVVGGGLGSLDVVKILMLETVLPVLKKRGFKIDLLQLEHASIHKMLDEKNLTLEDLSLKGCTLFYRRRTRDMPLADMPSDVSPERREKLYQIRERILRNFREKFLFKFQDCRIPTGLIVERGHLVGLKFKETEIIDGQVHIKEGNEQEVRTPLVVSSIGSIPEPIPGIQRNGELYDISDEETGQLSGFDNVFALGNVVTGQGNIRASSEHGKQVAEYISNSFLARRQEDYEEIITFAEQRSRKRVEEIAHLLQEKRILPVERITALLNSIKEYQERVGYAGDYNDWMEKHRPETIVDAIAAE